MPGSTLGSPLRRHEDPELVTGSALFTDDVRLAGSLHAAFARSTLPHARLLGVDTGPARRAPGVVGAFSGADLGLAPRLAFAILSDDFARPPLAVERVRFVGEAIAVIVAATRAQAEDAALKVEADYEPLPAVVDAEAALRDGSPLLFPGHDSNLAFEHAFGDGDALEGAELVVRARFVNQRLAPVPLEGNAVAAAPDAETGGLVVWASTQSPFQVRDAIAEALGLSEAEVRFVLPQVGGGFGGKIAVSPEQVVVAALAHRLRRPVRWAESRSENLLAMSHGRGQVQQVELGAMRSGRLTGLRAEVVCDAGAYPGQGAFLPYYTGQMAAGPYLIPKVDFRCRSAATNTTPTAAYRGAGRPEATALLERAMDMLAAELGIDPAELRRRNLVPAAAMPHVTATGATYDSGDYQAALEKALGLAGYPRLREEQARRRREGGRLLGVGLSVYVEVTAIGSPTEFARVEVGSDGRVRVAAGTASHGQGHATAYAQVAAHWLGIEPARVDVVEGDTGRVPRGDGTSASRSIQLAGAAVAEAAKAVREKASQLAAHLLEASVEDVAAMEGGIGVAGVPGSAISWAELARVAADPARLPPGLEPGLAASADFFQPDSTYPFGSHLAVVEVDPETGEVRLLRHVAVDDCGTIVNPLLAEGQVHGGVAQGVAQALYEEFVYGADGTPRTATLLDHGFPTAAELPAFETAHTVTPTPHNPLGAKGIGESGTIGSVPAVQNAVVDALAHLGVRHLDMPLTPEKVWRALREAGMAPGERAGPDRDDRPVRWGDLTMDTSPDPP